MSGDHFYTTDPNGELAPASGYELEQIACFVFAEQRPGSVPLFRFVHPTIGDHFYTLDPNGEIALQVGYIAEGPACFVFAEEHPGAQPLFRFFHPTIGDHFYTLDPNGEIALQVGYEPEGTACFVFVTEKPGAVPFFRWFQNGLMANFTFDAAITAENCLRLQQRHAFAHFRTRQCTTLSQKERSDVLAAYRKAIHHNISNDPTANALAKVGGSLISVNFANLFPLGDLEIAQTLLHEMMHCAGFKHPIKRNGIDVPGDNGQYFGSPPLRAEFCIAGMQSDAGTLTLALTRAALRAADATDEPFVGFSCPVVE